jgi:isoamylase
VVVPVSSIQTAGITGAVYYGYRAWGPNWPYNASWTKGSSAGFVSDVDASGNRFNPNKLLLDPYAREISQDPLNAQNQNANIFATGGTVDSSFGTAYRLIDSGTYAPKGIVLAASAQSTGTKPTRAQKDDVIYEVNVRGFTKQDPSIPTAISGHLSTVPDSRRVISPASALPPWSFCRCRKRRTTKTMSFPIPMPTRITGAT